MLPPKKQVEEKAARPNISLHHSSSYPGMKCCEIVCTCEIHACLYTTYLHYIYIYIDFAVCFRGSKIGWLRGALSRAFAEQEASHICFHGKLTSSTFACVLSIEKTTLIKYDGVEWLRQSEGMSTIPYSTASLSCCIVFRYQSERTGKVRVL